jgi:hypothetical protein
VHGLPAKGMICTLVFHVIGTSETILMSWLFAVARGARVPIFHIKAACEAHILIGKRFDNVRDFFVAREVVGGPWGCTG